MYYRDLIRAAPIVQREIDLVHIAATGDALTVYLWWMTRVAHRPTRNTFAGSGEGHRSSHAGCAHVQGSVPEAMTPSTRH
jgi:hypothetical protein